MKRFVALLAALLLIFAFFSACEKQSNYGETDRSKLNEEQAALLEEYPEYFGLDASGGLDVVVCQFGEMSYSFGLLEHSEVERDWMSEELMGLRLTNADQMKIILSTYELYHDDIHIVPYQNPLSSYIPEYWIVLDGESDDAVNARREAYIENIREMLFGKE